MTYTNTVILLGNTGDDVSILTSDEKTFASLSLATTDSYKDKEGFWLKKETVWHKVLIFNPALVLEAQAYPKGTRLKVTGTLSYRDFKVAAEDGTTITKREAAIIAGKIEEAPLTKKDVS